MRYFGNPIIVILMLISMFFLAAVSWIILNAEFLAFILILVYVGSITVLLLFCMMLVEPKHCQTNKLYTLLVGILTLGLISIFITIIEDYNLKIPIIINDKQLYSLGQILFTNYLLPIIIISLLLLVASIAAVCIKKYD